MIKREFWEKVAECWGKKEERIDLIGITFADGEVPDWVMDDDKVDDIDIQSLFDDGEIADLNDFVNMFANSDEDEIDVTAYFS